MVEILTIAPLPLLAIRGASSATRKYGALTLSEYTLSNSSSVISCVGPNGKIPALLIRISTWPFPSSTAFFATARAPDASRRSDEIKSALPPAAFRIAANDQNVDAEGGEPICHGPADTAGSSCNKRCRNRLQSPFSAS